MSLPVSRCRFAISVTVVALAITAVAATASAQSPFLMDGNPDYPVNQSIPDPFGNAQELGPSQGNKIGEVNEPLPVLGFVPTTGKVDLRRVWVKTALDKTSSDVWLYYAWERDANSGSGYVGLEFLQDELGSNCDYDGVNFTKPSGSTPVDATTQALINNCNPWRNRKDGDFFITWDQQGNVLNAQIDHLKADIQGPG